MRESGYKFKKGYSRSKSSGKSSSENSGDDSKKRMKVDKERDITYQEHAEYNWKPTPSQAIKNGES